MSQACRVAQPACRPGAAWLGLALRAPLQGCVGMQLQQPSFQAAATQQQQQFARSRASHVPPIPLMAL